MNGAGGAIGSSVQVSSTVSGPSNDPDVVWNGSVFGVLWTYRLSDNDKRFRLVGADGVPIDVPVDVVPHPPSSRGTRTGRPTGRRWREIPEFRDDGGHLLV